MSLLSKGSVPIGVVLSWMKSFANTPPLLPDEFVEANGQTISDSQSPYNGATIPNLNGQNRFLRGSSTSGGTGGSESHSHTVASTTTSISTAAGSTTITTTVSSPTGTESTLPSYYECVFIIRIK